MSVRLWFPFWLERHFQRHSRNDWPKPREKAAFYDGWIGNFIMHGVTEEVAEEASVRLMASPPAGSGDHIQAMLDFSRVIFRERAQSSQSTDPTDREYAQRESLNCPDCLGQGLTLRFRKNSVGSLDSNGLLVSAAITLYCTCLMGRWVEHNHRAKSPEIRRRIYDLTEHPFLQLIPTPSGPHGSLVLDNPYRTAPDGPLPEVIPQPAPEPEPTPTSRGARGQDWVTSLPPEMRRVWEHPKPERSPAGEKPAF